MSFILFVYHLGRIEEKDLHPDVELTRKVAKRLKEESKCLNKKNLSEKKVLEVVQRMKQLEIDMMKGELCDEEEEEKQDNSTNATPPRAAEKKKHAKDVLAKNFIKKEKSLRIHDLRSTSGAPSLSIPFNLKRIMTDDWEVISQCQMLHALPASVSVSNALDAYLEGKIRMLRKGENEANKALIDDAVVPKEEAPVSNETDNGNEEKERMLSLGNNPTACETNISKGVKDEEINAKEKASTDDEDENKREIPLKWVKVEDVNAHEVNNVVAETSEKAKTEDVNEENTHLKTSVHDPKSPVTDNLEDAKVKDRNGEKQPLETDIGHSSIIESTENKVETPIKKESQSNSKSIPDDNNVKISPEEEEWRNMTSGIAQFFDQALPSQLLYRQEVAQCSVLESNDTCADKRYCDLYPCEFLLRMFIMLPDMVQESQWLSEDEKGKIIYKLGDFVRFLGKNQNDFFIQKYRRPDEEEATKAKKIAEKEERMKMKKEKERNLLAEKEESLSDVDEESLSGVDEDSGDLSCQNQESTSDVSDQGEESVAWILLPSTYEYSSAVPLKLKAVKESKTSHVFTQNEDSSSDSDEDSGDLTCRNEETASDVSDRGEESADWVLLPPTYDYSSSSSEEEELQFSDEEDPAESKAKKRKLSLTLKAVKTKKVKVSHH